MDWYKFIKKYVWDDEKTPYLVPAGKLSRTQADYEIFAYALFLSVLFAVIGVVSFSDNAPQGKSYGVAFYAFSVVCGAISLGLTKRFFAAVYCGTVPLAALLYLFTFGFHPNLGTIDKYVLLAFIAIWLIYSVRVVNIAKAYGELPEKKEDP